MPHRGGALVARHQANHETLVEHPNENRRDAQRDVNTANCCVPSGCDLVDQPIRMDDLHDVVKVICNSDHCSEGRFMHRACFESWEDSVLTYLRSTGRARSWSEKQRLQNLWTKKGYDLAYKACGCKCAKGHLRKDLDWIPPAATTKTEEPKKKKKGKTNQRPSLTISTNPKAAKQIHRIAAAHDRDFPVPREPANPVAAAVEPPAANNNNYAHAGQGKGDVLAHRHSPNSHSVNNNVIPLSRLRTSSMSSNGSATSGGASPPIFGSEAHSPDLQNASIKKLFFGEQGAAASMHPRERRDSGSIFNRRHDYSTFNSLPRHKINSYHIKMEDDAGSDETRNFLVSALSESHVNRIQCILCQGSMPIFDRYPLIDGSFFLSPRQHSKSSVPVKSPDSKRLFLNAVCMGCLEGWNMTLRCLGCKNKWDGAHLILGSMYSYDIFAATPCCAERLRCNSCRHLVIPPTRRLDFFSDYSHPIACTHCGIVDQHFVKPLGLVYSSGERE